MTPSVQGDERLRRLSRLKPHVAPPEPGDLVKLPHQRSAFVYQRLSTHEQRKKSIWSIEMQDALREQALADGYRDDQVIVEARDLGISGTKGKEDRPGLANLVEQIEADQVEAVYVVHISRISRDQSLIDGLQFGELCKQHRVLIVMPTMRLNLRDSMHMRLYRQEIERAADEIELLKMRLGGPKRYKSLSGRFDGRSVPPGYILNNDAQTSNYERYVPYGPHAAVVRGVFEAVIEAGTPTRAARLLRERGCIFPAFPADMAAEAASATTTEPRSTHATRSSLVRNRRPLRRPGGFAISPSLVRSIVTNPVYLGWWLVAGEVVSRDNHPAIIEEDTFLRAQQALEEHGRGPGRRAGLASLDPRMLSGLLWCARHELPQQMTGSAQNAGRRDGRYQCDNDYDNGQSDHHCSLVGARTLDEPIADFVLGRCSFPEYAEAVLAQIEDEHSASREAAKHRERELAHLEQEIGTLKENLAITRSPEQVQMIFDLIETRKARLTELSDAASYPVGKMLTAAQVRTVRAFLADIRSGWAKQPLALRNEFLRLVLDRVLVDVGPDHIEVTILWRSGSQHRLWIERPIEARGGKVRWTEAENTWLREHYGTATVAAVEAALAGRALPAIRKQAQMLGVRREPAAIGASAGSTWTPEDDAALRAYAAGEIGYDTLRAGLPARSWDAILWRQGRLGLSGRVPQVHYRVVEGAQEMVGLEDASKTGS